MYQCPTCGQDTYVDFTAPEDTRITDLQLKGMLAKNEVVDFFSSPEKPKAETGE